MKGLGEGLIKAIDHVQRCIDTYNTKDGSEIDRRIVDIASGVIEALEDTDYNVREAFSGTGLSCVGAPEDRCAAIYGLIFISEKLGKFQQVISKDTGSKGIYLATDREDLSKMLELYNLSEKVQEEVSSMLRHTISNLEKKDFKKGAARTSEILSEVNSDQLNKSLELFFNNPKVSLLTFIEGFLKSEPPAAPSSRGGDLLSNSDSSAPRSSISASVLSTPRSESTSDSESSTPRSRSTSDSAQSITNGKSRGLSFISGKSRKKIKLTPHGVAAAVLYDRSGDHANRIIDDFLEYHRDPNKENMSAIAEFITVLLNSYNYHLNPRKKFEISQEVRFNIMSVCNGMLNSKLISKSSMHALEDAFNRFKSNVIYGHVKSYSYDDEKPSEDI